MVMHCYKKIALTGLLTAFGLTTSAIAQAQSAPQETVKKAAQHFSFSGKRPGFHEDNIDKIEVVVAGSDSEGRLSLIESIWTKDFSVDPHYHKLHAETFYIISGKVEWTIGGKTHVIGAGDLVHIPSNTIHSVKVLEEMHSLMFYQPGGYEDLVAFESSYTKKQRKDPKIMATIRAITDFHPVDGPGAATPEPKAGHPRKGIPTFAFRGQREGFTENQVEDVEVMLSGDESEGRLVIVQSYWLPGFNAPNHFHKQHTETFYIMSGKVEWTVNGETRVLGAGDAVHIPANVTHSVKVLEKIHTLWISDPGGLDDNAARRAGLTEEDQKDPRISRLLQQMGDFHIPPAN